MPDENMARLNAAREFLATVDLAELRPTRTREFAARTTPSFAPNAVKDQSVVAGADIISFVRGVTAERRTAITHSSLLAQLVANQKVGNGSSTEEWYHVYFKVLTSLGWVIQRTDFNTYEAMSDQADVHQAVLTIAEGVLGGATSSAYQLIKAAMDALKKLDAKSPWICLFHRESTHARSARFEVALADQGARDDFLVTLLAFNLEASTTITQVLLFKFKAERATLRQYSGSVSIDDTVLLTCAQAILEKISAFVQDYIKELPDLAPEGRGSAGSS